MPPLPNAFFAVAARTGKADFDFAIVEQSQFDGMVEPPAFADFQQVYVMRGNVRLLGNGFQVETQAASGSLQRTSERMLGVFTMCDLVSLLRFMMVTPKRDCGNRIHFLHFRLIKFIFKYHNYQELKYR